MATKPVQLIAATLLCAACGAALSQPFPSYSEERLPGALAIKSLVGFCAQSAGYFTGMAKLRNQGLSIDEALARSPTGNPYSTSPRAKASLEELWGRKRYNDPVEVDADLEEIANVAFNRCMNRNLAELKPYKPDSF